MVHQEAKRERRRAARRLRAVAVLAVAGACAAGLTACGGSSAKAGSASSGSASASGRISGTVTVLAAASLQPTFTELGKEFEAAHPGTKVAFSFGGSDSLAASIIQGAPADVFAAASETTMQTVTKAGDAAGTPADFARNQLEIAVPPGNPKKITELSQLASPELKVALCAKTVPCGAAAVKAEAAAKVSITPVTYEQDVTSALNKVELGEVDAALVYRTDVNSAKGKVTGVPFAASAGAVTTYPIAVLKGAPNPDAAAAFVALVRSAQGQKVLAGAGFQKP